MTIPKKRRGVHSWKSSHRVFGYLAPKLIVYRSFDDIERRSQALLGKGTMAQILDKAQGSQAIVRLVEQLRQAVLVYQVRTRVAEFESS
jgi:hypothetical protein